MALLDEIYSLVVRHWPWMMAVLVTTHFLRNRYRSGLNKIPGPFLASITNLWQAYHCFKGRSSFDYELHEKFNSPLLRLGPNTISVADPEAIRKIYGYKPAYLKSDFYISQIQTNKLGEPYDNLASTRDENFHGRLRRPVANAYSMSRLVGYEPLIDTTFLTFAKEMNQRFVQTGKECPLHLWLQMYAFDVIGELTFSKRLGFLETGTDVGNMMYFTGKMMAYTGVMGHLPFLDKWLRVKNPVLRMLSKFPIVQFTVDQVAEHEKDPGSHSNPDLLTEFMKAREKFPDIMDEDRIAENARSAIGAGSDTTAIAIRELVYQFLTIPRCFDKFFTELKETLAARPINEEFDKPISWTEGNNMLYYQACIKEVLRFHPPLAQLLPREVPQGGATLCGEFIPEGTTVGCNGWVVHRDKDLYGDTAGNFYPERWLESDQEHIQRMVNLNFAFGGGSRVCIGKNIALLEITKFIPEFFRRFEVRLVDPARYKAHPGWLVPQSGLDVMIKPRDQASLKL